MQGVTLRMAFALAGTVLLAVPRLAHSQEQAEYCEPAARRWSADWYEYQAMKPVAAQQHYSLGKWWPPFPRPATKPQCSHIFHHNHYWPLPYVCYDRDYVYTALSTQTTNGWVRETTLYDYHFDPTTQRLTQAGELHLEWILNHTPARRRMAFVQSTINADLNQQRLQNVRNTALAMTAEQDLPPIMLRTTQTLSRPAAEIVTIRRAEFLSQPVPRVPLPDTQTAGTDNVQTGL